jgi:hypothetical protein
VKCGAPQSPPQIPSTAPDNCNANFPVGSCIFAGFGPQPKRTLQVTPLPHRFSQPKALGNTRSIGAHDHRPQYDAANAITPAMRCRFVAAPIRRSLTKDVYCDKMWSGKVGVHWIGSATLQEKRDESAASEPGRDNRKPEFWVAAPASTKSAVFYEQTAIRRRAMRSISGGACLGQNGEAGHRGRHDRRVCGDRRLFCQAIKPCIDLPNFS